MSLEEDSCPRFSQGGFGTDIKVGDIYTLVLTNVFILLYRFFSALHIQKHGTI